MCPISFPNGICFLVNMTQRKPRSVSNVADLCIRKGTSIICLSTVYYRIEHTFGCSMNVFLWTFYECIQTFVWKCLDVYNWKCVYTGIIMFIVHIQKTLTIIWWNVIANNIQAVNLLKGRYFDHFLLTCVLPWLVNVYYKLWGMLHINIESLIEMSALYKK